MIETITTPTVWNQHLTAHNGHLLQSWAWGQLKSQFDWTPCRIEVQNAAAQILFKPLPLGRSIAYIPKGPLLDWTDSTQAEALLAAIHAEAQRRGAVFLKIEPNLWSLEHAPPHARPTQAQAAAQVLEQAGFSRADAIQPVATIVIDIDQPEEAILAAMKQKTRYNIRLAGRKEVTIRRGQAGDVATFHQLSRLTANRDEFGIHSHSYYQAAYDLFAPERCVLLLAEFEEEPLAGLMAFAQGETAYYFYGASSNAHRNRMPTYLIQWEAIRWAREQGCTRYDLWGVPPASPQRLEAEFMERSDGLWGVYRFKRGFGGQVIHSLGAFDYVYTPWLYKLYRWRRGSDAA